MKPFYRYLSLIIIILIWTSLVQAKSDQQEPLVAVISDETQECIDCHETETPGIVQDWLTSRHSITTPAMALQKEPLERRISSKEIPATLQAVVVGCYECHSLNAANHKDNFNHNEFDINVIVSPKDCSTCHAVEVEEYSHSKKAHALDILKDNPLYHALVETIDGVREIDGDEIIAHKASENTKGKTCYACHGTVIEVKGMKTVETASDEIEVPDLTNWPNQGVGRINPDGSKGSCTACHPRHSFSIEIARKPYTCSQCHLAPDVPAWEVYKESKHGNIFSSMQDTYDWNQVPWRVGKDFKAPTCASCHNSLLTTPDGDIVAGRSHDFGARLWVRIFGLIYAHPQPKSGNTSIIKNQDNLPLPTTFDGRLATDYLIDKAEQMKRQGVMKNVCRSCHSTDWINGHFIQMDSTIVEADKMVLAATQLMQNGWNAGIADATNPFDEGLERKWMQQWLFYANSVRYASAMGGPDYASFKYGWWDLTKNLQDMHDAIELKKNKQGKK